MTVRLLPGPGGWPEDDDRRRHPPAPPAPPAGPLDPGRTDRGAPPVIELRGLTLRGPGEHRPGAHRAARGRRGRRGELPAPWAAQLDLTVWPGELVMLTGRPRSGRSALLNVIGLLDRPATGSYLLHGIDTAKLRDRDRSALRGRQIGFVFQRKMLLPSRSVIDNVMLPLRYTGVRGRDRVTAAIDSLDRVGLGSRAALMTWQLSAGELALCAIARALVTQPSLLLCDEPTAGVDEATAARVTGLLANVHRQGTTVMVATADQLAAAYSSRLVRLGEPAGRQRANPLAGSTVLRDTIAIDDANAGRVP
jgi:putative ABC transport system ATP-binding protein